MVTVNPAAEEVETIFDPVDEEAVAELMPSRPALIEISLGAPPRKRQGPANQPHLLGFTETKEAQDKRSKRSRKRNEAH